MIFLSTLSLRRATSLIYKQQKLLFISIHALLAESDHIRLYVSSINEISIHALLAESDSALDIATSNWSLFLSTLSLRRATVHITNLYLDTCHFYPRSPCGERLKLFAKRFCNSLISIHALLAESDISCAWSASKLGDFYPRSPCGERLLRKVPILGIK